MTVPNGGNLRYVLRAYETPDAARLAVLLVLAAEDSLPRRRLAEMWADRRPQDLAPTNDRTIRNRIARAASLMHTAGAVTRDGDYITVTDWSKIAMMAANLEILETPDGNCLPPGRWYRRPAAPPEVRHVQDSLATQRGTTWA